MSLASTTSAPPAAAGGPLPALESSFIGRARELHELTQLLSATRLLTLVGAGGCGKTRLALQWCHDGASQQHFADGIVWCDLASLSDPAQVPARLAAQLQLGAQAERSPLDALRAAMAPRELLIILDNCDHLLAACAALAQTLLHSCPQLKLLATSLQPLGLLHESVWRVPPLSLPRAELRPQSEQLTRVPDLLASDAVQLFVARAQHVAPSFALHAHNAQAVALICQQLDGMPLAIELAAARVQLLSPAQIAARLDDRFRLLTHGATDPLPRHQTLRATMDWSYALLSADEQLLLRRLSVFAGSFTVEMAESVCGDPSTADGQGASVFTNNVLDLLTNLVDKSLVTIHERDAQGVARFRLLETIRQYAREKLEQSGEAIRLRERLLEWAVVLVEQASPHLKSKDAVAWMRQLEVNLDNIRAALRSVRATERLDLGMRLVGALWRFWERSGSLSEGQSACAELFAIEDELRANGALRIAPTLRAWALHTAGRILARLRHPAGERYARECLELFRASGDRRGEANAFELVTRYQSLQNGEGATRELTQQALALFREVGDDAGMSRTLNNLGVAAYGEGNFRDAQRYFDESLLIERELDAHPALQIGNLAGVLMVRGDYIRAQALLEESLAIAQHMSDNDSQIFVLGNLCETALNQGDITRAEAHGQALLSLCERIGISNFKAVPLVNLGSTALVRSALGEARTHFVDGLELARAGNAVRETANAENGLGLVHLAEGNLSQAAAYSRRAIASFQRAHLRVELLGAIENLAVVLTQQGDMRRAARWLALTAALRESMGTPIAPTSRTRYAQTVEALRAALGADGFAAIQSGARDLTLEQVLAEALGEQRDEESVLHVMPSPPKSEPALRVYALGATRVFIGAREVESGDWTYHKSKELFFYLLLNPPARKAQIGLDLWPDASPEQLRNNFHRALHYVRKALGRLEWIAFNDGVYALASDANPWCDVRDFESRLAKAWPLLKSGLPQPAERKSARQLLTDAIQLWRGDLLADVDVGEWAIERREALRAAYVQALMNLGQLHVADALYGEAIEVYRQVLAQDDYFEAAHRELMRCYARLGETSRALRHYQSLWRLLRDELAAVPSPETTLLYERLRRGDDV